VWLLAWNIRQGGGSRLVGIMAAIARHDADATEPVPPPQRTGVLIAARRRFVERGPLLIDLQRCRRSAQS
jgi:hypothetical protein